MERAFTFLGQRHSANRVKGWSLAVGVRTLLLIAVVSVLMPSARALPSFARQTGQRCAACHVGGNWPQLTPWGRFFKLSGYAAGKSMIDREGFNYLPIGILGQVGLTWAKQPNDAQGNEVVSSNGVPQAYGFTGQIGTKITDFAGIFYEYGVNNQFPGWKGGSGPIDVRAVHIFHPGNHELLVGADSNNGPGLQDVWNSIPTWTFPFYGSPQAPGAPGSPVFPSLEGQSGSIGGYGLLDRQLYFEVSMYRVGNDFFRWMTAGNSLQAGPYLKGNNPYWRAYWTKEFGPHVFEVGTFGLHANVYPDSTMPSGRADSFADTGFDTQYQYLRDVHKFTLRGTYVYENQDWSASFPLGASAGPKANLKTASVSGSYAYREAWTFSAGWLLSNGSNNSAFYSVSDPNGNTLSSKPNTTGYILEVDRSVTQNIQVMVQYSGFSKFNGLTGNIDGLGRKPSDNNTLWLSVFFAY